MTKCDIVVVGVLSPLPPELEHRSPACVSAALFGNRLLELDLEYFPEGKILGGGGGCWSSACEMAGMGPSGK